MSFFESPKYPAKNKKINPEKNKEDMTRRRFLKTTGGAVALLSLTAAGATALEKIRGLKSSGIFQEKDDFDRYLPENFGEAEEDGFSQAKNIRKEDWEAVHNILGKFDLNDVSLTAGKIKQATENYHYKNHKEKPERLIKGVVAMSGWISRLKDVFREEFREIFNEDEIPVDLVFLALPESYWDVNAVSLAGAVGPYQIMKKTGLSYKMRIDEKVDDRKDPIKSARLCARHLKDSYKKTKDWDLTLSAYNGGFVNRYVESLKGTDQKISYDGFVEYMGEEINGLKKKLRGSKWSHEVKDGETVSKISARYHAEPGEIIKQNKLKRDKNGNPIIHSGKIIMIPIEKVESKKSLYFKKIAGYIENLNYPGKYYAIMRILKEPDFQKKILARAEEEAQRNRMTAKKS